MQIRVTRVEQRHGGDCFVHFETPHGQAVGRWAGQRPVEGARYVVDVEVAECLSVGRTLLTIPPNGSAKVTSSNANTILIQGIVERAWPEGVLSLRVGRTLIDVEADQLIDEGKWVLAECREIRLHDRDV